MDQEKNIKKEREKNKEIFISKYLRRNRIFFLTNLIFRINNLFSIQLIHKDEMVENVSEINNYSISIYLQFNHK